MVPVHSSLPFRAIMKPSPGGVFSADDVRHFCYQLSSVQQKRDTANEIMNMATRSLLQFLKEARHAHLQFLSSGVESQSPIYVVGNPSVDLDSIISAIVYSYFAHNRTPDQLFRASPCAPHQSCKCFRWPGTAQVASGVREGVVVMYGYWCWETSGGGRRRVGGYA